MTDSLLRAISTDGCYRLAAARTTETVQELIKRHRPDSAAAQAIARAVTATALLGTAEKDFHRVAVQWNGRGPFQILIADVRPGGYLRSYVGESSSGAESIKAGVGSGILSVTRQDPEGRFTPQSLRERSIPPGVLTRGQPEQLGHSRVPHLQHRCSVLLRS